MTELRLKDYDNNGGNEENGASDAADDASACADDRDNAGIRLGPFVHTYYHPNASWARKRDLS